MMTFFRNNLDRIMLNKTANPSETAWITTGVLSGLAEYIKETHIKALEIPIGSIIFKCR